MAKKDLKLKNSQVQELLLEISDVNQRKPKPRLKGVTFLKLSRLTSALSNEAEQFEESRSNLFESLATKAKADSKEMIQVDVKDPQAGIKKSYEKGDLIIPKDSKEKEKHDKELTEMLEKQVTISSDTFKMSEFMYNSYKEVGGKLVTEEECVFSIGFLMIIDPLIEE